MKEKTKEKIMIVDDALFMQKLISGMLMKHDYKHIIFASDGEEAISLFDEHRPDIVLLDITLPKMSGITVLSEILKIDAKAKVVMCSAMGQEKLITEALRKGAKDFIVKPFHEDGLIHTITSIIER